MRAYKFETTNRDEIVIGIDEGSDEIIFLDCNTDKNCFKVSLETSKQILEFLKSCCEKEEIDGTIVPRKSK